VDNEIEMVEYMRPDLPFALLRAISSESATATVPVAAKLLGISRNSAYEAVRRGEIPSITIGRRKLVPLAALEQLLASARYVTPVRSPS
jgi:excisionase family DNA binding protein